jgi:hypothetical protein
MRSKEFKPIDDHAMRAKPDSLDFDEFYHNDP